MIDVLVVRRAPNLYQGPRLALATGAADDPHALGRTEEMNGDALPGHVTEEDASPIADLGPFLAGDAVVPDEDVPDDDDSWTSRACFHARDVKDAYDPASTFHAPCHWPHLASCPSLRRAPTLKR